VNVREILSNRYLLLASRVVLGMVFVVAAIPKIGRPDSFAVSIEAYEMLPLAAVNAVAIVVPWIELICGLFLVAGVRARAGSALLGGLLVVFIVAISTAVLRGLDINCGCFGTAVGTPVGWGRVLEDVALLLPAWLLARPGADPAGEPRHPGTTPPPATRERA
jgi:putative oxidoreductase